MVMARGALASAAVGSASANAVVILSAGERGAIRVAKAELRRFVETRDAPGNISIADDTTLVQAQSALIAAAATRDRTRLELRRVSGLGATGGIARKEIEQAIADQRTAQAAYVSALDAVRVLGLSDTQIRAMLATGRIAPSRTGDSRKWVTAMGFEDDAPAFHDGEPVTVTVEAYPGRRFEGWLRRVYPVVDPNLHRIMLRALVSDPRNQLRPGMLATVRVQVSAPVISVAVAQDGVVREGDGTMTVWTTTDGRRFEQRTVSIGQRQGGYVQVLAGLVAGESVVTRGAVFLDNMLDSSNAN